MAIGIFISNPTDQPSGKDSPVFISNSSFSMLTLVYPVADIIEAEHPEIFVKAFESIAWGEVHINNLNTEEFMIVYEITKKVYLEREPGSLTTVGGRGKNWDEYMEKLEQDSRYNKKI